MTQTPPELYCPTPKEEREPYQTYTMRYRCPWCGSDLELQNRVSWIRGCPQCPYEWVPPRHV
jgi:hypothetical protein